MPSFYKSRYTISNTAEAMHPFVRYQAQCRVISVNGTPLQVEQQFSCRELPQKIPTYLPSNGEAKEFTFACQSINDRSCIGIFPPISQPIADL